MRLRCPWRLVIVFVSVRKKRSKPLSLLVFSWAFSLRMHSLPRIFQTFMKFNEQRKKQTTKMVRKNLYAWNWLRWSNRESGTAIMIASAIWLLPFQLWTFLFVLWRIFFLFTLYFPFRSDWCLHKVTWNKKKRFDFKTKTEKGRVERVR